MTAQCWNIRENYGPFGAFFLSILKMDRSGEESRDMVTLRKKNMLRDWMCTAATDGWCADWACVTPVPKITSVHHINEDHDEDIVNLKHDENLANAAKGRSTVLVQEDFDDTNSASNDSLSPDFGEVWRSVIVPDNISDEVGSATSSTFSSEESFEYHEYNVRNSCWMLCVTLRLVLFWERSLTMQPWGELLLRAISRWIYCVTRHLPCRLSTITSL